MSCDVIIFDLDGTLTDSAEGIFNSFIYSLKHFGIEEKKENLSSVIGPSLSSSFRSLYGFEGEKAKEAIKKYREYYSEKGIFENQVYDGIKELLEKLNASGKTLLVATAKPINYAKIILEHFDMIKYFKFVCGAELDGSVSEKTEILGNALKLLEQEPTKNIIMIGDRKHDIIAANHYGISSSAVLYGYGTIGELQKENPTHIVNTVSDLSSILL